MGVRWDDDVRRRVPALPGALRLAPEVSAPPVGPKRGVRHGSAGLPATDYRRMLDALARIHKENR